MDWMNDLEGTHPLPFRPPSLLHFWWLVRNTEYMIKDSKLTSMQRQKQYNADARSSNRKMAADATYPEVYRHIEM